MGSGQAEQRGGTGRSAAPGVLAALAGAARGPGAPLERSLADLARALGADRLEWWPADRERPAASSRGRPRERELDRSWLEGLPAGTACRLPRGRAARRPRLACGPAGETWVATSAGASRAGWLRVVDERPVDAPGREFAEELVGLADLVAGLPALGRGDEAGPAGPNAHDWKALVHDLRNELTFAQLALERAAVEGAAPTADVLATLARSRELCAGALRGNSLAVAPRAVALRTLLSAEARVAAGSSRGPEGARVRVRCAADLFAAADPVRLGRVVRNLALNALDASGSGGVVDLSAERHGPGVRIVVEDRGRGMSAAEVAALYRPGATGGRGFGWGTASIVAGIAELGGALALETGPGEGTRVEVELWSAPAPDRPAAVRIDGDRERAAGRVRALEARGLGVWVVPACARARALLASDAAIVRVEMAAGETTPGWRELEVECRARGIEFQVRSSAAPREPGPIR